MATTIIIIFFILGVTVGLIVTKWELTRKNWPTTAAYVTSTEIIPDLGRTTLLNPQVAVLTNVIGLAYNVELSYEYRVGQNKYFGKSINLTSDKRISKERAEERVKSIYQQGAKIEIYYNPKKPGISMQEKAVLARGIQIITWTVIIAILLLLLTASLPDVVDIFA